MTWEILCAVFFGLVLLFNALSGLGIFFKSQREVSESLENDVVPYPFFFSIWGIIYSWIIVMLVFSFLGNSAILVKFAPWFIASCCFNIAWIVAFGTGQIRISYFIILMIWAALYGCYTYLEVYYSSTVPTITYWCFNAPISVYFGWITVASFVSIFSMQIFPRDLQAQAATVIFPLLLLPVHIALIYFGDYFFVGAIVWGLAGIVVRNMNAEAIAIRSISIVSAIAIALIGLMVGYRMIFIGFP